MFSLKASSEGFNGMAYDIPVFREINMLFDWFGGLIWYWQIAVAIATLGGVWLILKIIATIFGTSDE